MNNPYFNSKVAKKIKNSHEPCLDIRSGYGA
jgi:hypothetical protein